MDPTPLLDLEDQKQECETQQQQKRQHKERKQDKNQNEEAKINLVKEGQELINIFQTSPEEVLEKEQKLQQEQNNQDDDLNLQNSLKESQKDNTNDNKGIISKIDQMYDSTLYFLMAYYIFPSTSFDYFQNPEFNNESLQPSREIQILANVFSIFLSFGICLLFFFQFYRLILTKHFVKVIFIIPIIITSFVEISTRIVTQNVQYESYKNKLIDINLFLKIINTTLVNYTIKPATVLSLAILWDLQNDINKESNNQDKNKQKLVNGKASFGSIIKLRWRPLAVEQVIKLSFLAFTYLVQEQDKVLIIQGVAFSILIIITIILSFQVEFQKQIVEEKLHLEQILEENLKKKEKLIQQDKNQNQQGLNSDSGEQSRHYKSEENSSSQFQLSLFSSLANNKKQNNNNNKFTFEGFINKVKILINQENRFIVTCLFSFATISQIQDQISQLLINEIDSQIYVLADSFQGKKFIFSTFTQLFIGYEAIFILIFRNMFDKTSIKQFKLVIYLILACLIGCNLCVLIDEEWRSDDLTSLIIINFAFQIIEAMFYTLSYCLIQCLFTIRGKKKIEFILFGVFIQQISKQISNFIQIWIQIELFYLLIFQIFWLSFILFLFIYILDRLPNYENKVFHKKKYNLSKEDFNRYFDYRKQIYRMKDDPNLKIDLYYHKYEQTYYVVKDLSVNIKQLEKDNLKTDIRLDQQDMSRTIISNSRENMLEKIYYILSSSKELLIMEKIQNINNVIKLHYICKNIEIEKVELNIKLIMDYAYEGSLQNEIDQKISQREHQQKQDLVNKQNNKFTNSEIQEMLKTFITTQEALQKQGVIHRDIKPDNILKMHGQYYFSDFGVSFLIENINEPVQGVKGTPYYFDPQLLIAYKTEQKPDNKIYEKADVFSLGITMLQTCLLMNKRDLLNLNKDDKFLAGKLDELQKQYSRKNCAIIGDMLEWEQEKRLTFAELAKRYF